jgi:hypothetical protein
MRFFLDASNVLAKNEVFFKKMPSLCRQPKNKKSAKIFHKPLYSFFMLLGKFI